MKSKEVSTERKSRSPASNHVVTADYLRFLHKSPARDSMSPANRIKQELATMKLLDRLKKESTINEEQSFYEESITSPVLLQELSGKKSNPLHSVGSDMGTEQVTENYLKHLNASGEKTKKSSLPQFRSSNFLTQLASPGVVKANSSPGNRKELSNSDKNS